VEEQMNQLEALKTKWENEMTKPEVYGNTERLKEVQSTFNKVEVELVQVNRKWEEIATTIDALSAC